MFSVQGDAGSGLAGRRRAEVREEGLVLPRGADGRNESVLPAGGILGGGAGNVDTVGAGSYGIGRQGPVGRQSPAGYIGVVQVVQGEGISAVRAGGAQVGRILHFERIIRPGDRVRLQGVQPEDERVVRAHQVFLIDYGTHRDRQIVISGRGKARGGQRPTGHEYMVGRRAVIVQGDSCSRLVRIAVDIGSVKQAGTGSVDLGYEGVGGPDLGT